MDSSRHYYQWHSIDMDGDGGTGSADNDLPAHINIRLADWYSVCGVREFSLDITRDELDVTTLPCADGGEEGCTRLAAFRSRNPATHLPLARCRSISPATKTTSPTASSVLPC